MHLVHVPASSELRGFSLQMLLDTRMCSILTWLINPHCILSFP